jgi:2-oxo-hept-3-ene-1,7-dioate hydratase
MALTKDDIRLASPIETRKGDTIQADYGPYGSVGCYFA